MLNVNQIRREYNIINFAPVQVNQESKLASTKLEPLRTHGHNKLRNTNMSTINIFDQAPKNADEDKSNTIEYREKKNYDPLLESKLTLVDHLMKREKKTLFNAPALDYDFISFVKKNSETIDTIRNRDPRATKKYNAISAFAEGGKVYSTNINPNFQEVISHQKNAFRIKTGLGGKYLDHMRSYGDLPNCWKRAGK